jgi:DNA-binding response OmpR family regulator
MLSYAFKAKNYLIEPFTKGKKALEYLLDKKNLENASLLILDRLLPDMEGLDILKAFDKKYPEGHIPVLILSMLSAETDVLEGLKQGAVDYITKPFSLSVLIEKAKALIESKKR